MDDDHGLDDELVDRCGQQMMSSHVDSRDKQLATIGQTWEGGGGGGGGGAQATLTGIYL